MTAKWADHLRSAVRYNADESHIAMVRVHPDHGDTVGAGVGTTRLSVVSQITAGSTFATIYRTDDGQWTCGAKVEVVTIDGTKYLRTTPDKIKKDNLGNLPRF